MLPVPQRSNAELATKVEQIVFDLVPWKVFLPPDYCSGQFKLTKTWHSLGVAWRIAGDTPGTCSHDRVNLEVPFILSLWLPSMRIRKRLGRKVQFRPAQIALQAFKRRGKQHSCSDA